MEPQDRGYQWMLAIEALGRMPQFATVVMQGLARLDLQLIAEAAVINQRLASLQIRGDLTDWLAREKLLADHMTLSYLWALGGYEVILTVDQRVRDQQLV